MQTGSYQKRPDEDLMSIITGITQPKGRIQMSVGRPVNLYLDKIEEKDTLNNKLTRLAELIDAEVYSHYKLWPGNYIAFDIMNDCDRNQTHFILLRKRRNSSNIWKMRSGELKETGRPLKSSFSVSIQIP